MTRQGQDAGKMPLLLVAASIPLIEKCLLAQDLRRSFQWADVLARHC
jgi:hypothetical protein